MKNKYIIYLGLVLLAVVPLRGSPEFKDIPELPWLITAEQKAAEDKQIAELGDKLYTLGWQYYDAKDYAEAVKAFSMAAKECRNARAQNSLGEMYFNGTGVKKDNFEAARWFFTSAKQGYALAQYHIGLMLAMGMGVPKDLVTAHVWLNLAGANGCEPAKEALEHIEKKMTDSQKERAMALAGPAWARYPKYPANTVKQ